MVECPNINLTVFTNYSNILSVWKFITFTILYILYRRHRSALAVICCVKIHCLEVSCTFKEDQITSKRLM